MRDMRADQISRDQISEVYSVPFSAVTYSAAMDMFAILTPADRTTRIRDIVIAQYSDFGDAQAEIIPILFYQGYTSAGSVGTLVTPQNIDGNEARIATTTVRCNDTTIASGGSPILKYASAWNVAAGLWYYPPQAERFWIPPSTRFVVRCAAPADALTINGTLIIEEAMVAP